MKTLLTAAVTMLSFSMIAQNDSSAYFFAKGNEAKAERRFLVASQHYQKSLQYSATNLEAQKELGLVYTEMRKYDLALKSFAEVVKTQPNDPVVVENLTNLYFSTRKWNDAIVYAKKMQELKIGKNSNYILGKCYYEMENYGQAFPYLDAAAKDEPNNAEIPYLVGRSYVDMSNYRNAAPWFEKAIALDSTRARWIYECALNFAAIPDDNNAIKYYHKAAEKGYKTDNDYYENLAASYLGLGKADECLVILKGVLEKKPSDITLLNSVADICYRSGKYEEAIGYWDRVLESDKKNAHSLYMIGMSYQKKGDKNKGTALCDKAIAMDPSLANMRQKKMSMGL
jgi:tetratricopeptide (TPR) repeat protein